MHAPRSVITIGNFDGVHVGHAALVTRAAELARTVPGGARVVAMAFDPHPMTRLKPEAAPARLTTFEQRVALLRAAGADEVVKLEPRDEVLHLSPEEFVRTLLLPRGPAYVVEGSDFHFGKARAGNVRVLGALAASMGFAADVVAPVEVALTDHLIVTASSTVVRWLLSHGRVRDAAIVLGRPYEMQGVVTQGDQRGRTIGFPTANLASDQMLPADGVYAAIASLPDGRDALAAVNVGARPTFKGVQRRVEAHLFDAAGAPALQVPAGYDWPLRLRFVGFVRDQVRFDSVDRLRAQLSRDIGRASVILHHSPAPASMNGAA